MVTTEEVIELLMDLNQLRKRTRELARTKIEPGAVHHFIDRFQKIEDQVLDEVVAKLRGCVVMAQLEIEQLRNRISELESEYLHTPLEDGQRLQLGQQ